MNKNIIIGNIPVYCSYPNDGNKYPGLIIIHEIWGLEDHIKSVADRFAKEGYFVVAPNLFHGMPFEGKIDNTLLNDMHDPDKKDEAQKKLREALAPIREPEFAAQAINKLKQCVDYLLENDAVTNKIGVLGFCFGGTYSFHLAAHDKEISATVAFYGQPPTGEEIRNITSPMLAFYGDQDTALMESLPLLQEAMDEEGKDFESVVYKDTGHAFFNDTNTRMYNEAAASDAWEKTLAFLRKNLFPQD